MISVENYQAVQQALGVGRQEIAQMGRNGFAGSFMGAEEKARALAAFDRAVAA